MLLAGVAALVAVAMATAALAVRQGERADSAATAAEARRIASRAVETDEIALSLLLGVEAVRLDDSADTRASLLTVLERNPAAIGSIHGDHGLTGLAVSPDGDTIALGEERAGTTFFDAATLVPRGDVDGESWRIEYRPDGDQLAIAASSTGLLCRAAGAAAPPKAAASAVIVVCR